MWLAGRQECKRQREGTPCLASQTSKDSLYFIYEDNGEWSDGPWALEWSTVEKVESVPWVIQQEAKKKTFEKGYWWDVFERGHHISSIKCFKYTKEAIVPYHTLFLRCQIMLLSLQYLFSPHAWDLGRDRNLSSALFVSNGEKRPTEWSTAQRSPPVRQNQDLVVSISCCRSSSFSIHLSQTVLCEEVI